ncbi:hypothetical protein FOBRF1_004450 [Fusarium oxysporum]
MALYYWFKDGPQQSSRDWVFALGDYHPAYNAPAQHPSPPRLQIAWSLGPLLITGSAYFAVSPSVAVAGASLHATLDIGVLHAFLDAWADSLINYQPFMFTASGGINVGGVCHVNFWVFGFDIAFGPSDGVESPAPIQLLEFYRLTLQRQTATEEDSSKPHIFTCNSGLVSSMKPEPKDPKEVTKMAHDFAPNSDSPPLVSSVTAAITDPPVNKTEFGRTSGEKSVWELRAVISSVPKALWDKYDPSKDPSKNSRSLLDPSGPATVYLMMGVQLIPPEAHSRDDRIKLFDAVKSQLEDVIKPINFPDTTKFQNDTWMPALPVKPTPDNPAKLWGAVRDLWLKPKDGEGSAKKAVELWITAMNWTVGDLTGVVPERAAKD